MPTVIEPKLPAGPLPTTSDDLADHRSQVLEYLEFVAESYAPDLAKQEIEKAAALLIEIVEADYAAWAREDGEERY